MGIEGKGGEAEEPTQKDVPEHAAAAKATLRCPGTRRLRPIRSVAAVVVALFVVVVVPLAAGHTDLGRTAHVSSFVSSFSGLSPPMSSSGMYHATEPPAVELTLDRPATTSSPRRRGHRRRSSWPTRGTRYTSSPSSCVTRGRHGPSTLQDET